LEQKAGEIESMDENTVPPNGELEKPEDVSIPSSVFLVLEGTKAIPLDKAHITIGRSHDNTIILDDPRVSRHHLEIRVIRDHFVLFDLNSSGGTFVNGQRINQAILYLGDMISLAGVNLVFMQDNRLTARGDASKIVGPGQRATAVFNPDTDRHKKKSSWW
jgi:pSer/pThr/pTyr-binding forkhead associated (FHA) protein